MLIVIFITFSILILWSLLSFKIDKNIVYKPSKELLTKLKKFDIILFFSFFLIIMIFTIIISYSLNWVSESLIKLDENVISFIKPTKVDWICMSAIFSLSISVSLIYSFTKYFLKDNFDIYWLYYNEKYKRFNINASLLLKYLSIIILIVSTINICLELDTYVIFKNKTIEINSYTELKSREYPLDSLVKIVHYQKTIAPNGNIIEKPHYAIIFADGFQWKSIDNLRTPSNYDDELFNNLAQRANLKIEEIEIEK